MSDDRDTRGPDGGPDDIRARNDGARAQGPGEGYGSDRPGDEYGAGERGYAGPGAGERPGGPGGAGPDPYGGAQGGGGQGNQGYGSGGYGAGYGGAGWSPGGGYGDYRARGGGFREAMGGAGPRVLDDLARLVTDAAGAAQGVRREVETAFRAQAESVLGRMDVVRRDEFEAVAEMASRARAECETLRMRIEELEARLNSMGARAGTGRE